MTTDRGHVRVVLADDQTLVRQGIGALLSFAQDITVVGEAANGKQAVELARDLVPDVVLMDIHMPVLDGIKATRAIREHYPNVAVIVLTTFDHDEYVLDAIRAGACGFLLKDGDGDDLLRAVHLAADGDAVIAPSLLGHLLSTLALAPTYQSSAVHAVATLTDREREVLQLVARGRSNVEISRDLHITEATVKSHIGHLFAKIGVRDRAQSVVVAYESGLVQAGKAPPIP
ncbi:MAG: response regulator transcription factor [Nocardioides sp.]